MEGKLDVAGIECGSFNKGKVVLACSLSSASKQLEIFPQRKVSHTCKLLCLLCWYSPQMPQIALVSYQHDDDVRVRMIPQLLQPPRHILVRLMLADIVDEQGTDSSSVVGRCDGSVSFLTRGIPDLCLDRLRIDLNRSGCELYTDGGLGVKVELIACESTQEIGFTNSGVSDQDNCSHGCQ